MYSAQSVRRGLRQTIRGGSKRIRRSGEQTGASCKLAGWQIGRARGIEEAEQARGEERIGSRESDSLTAISPDSRYVFVWRDQRLSKDMSDCAELSGAARWKWNGVSVLNEVWFVPILGPFSHSPQAPRVPVSPFRWAATGQKSVQFSPLTHPLSPQSAIPAEALAPPLHEPLQARNMEDPSAGVANLPLT